MKKTILSLLVVAFLAVMVSMNTNSGAAAVAGSFPDVKSGYWAKAKIDAAVAKGYVSGFPDGTFRPEQKVSRAEFVKMVVDAMDFEAAAGGSPWYQPYVDAAIGNGLHREADFKSYAAQISRLEIMRIVSRGLSKTDSYAGYLELFKDLYNGDLPFVDYRDLKPADLPFAALAFGSGIVNGYPDATIGLGKTATRAEAVVMIENLLSVRSKDPMGVQYLQELVGVAEMGTNAPAVSKLEVRTNIKEEKVAFNVSGYSIKLKRAYVMPLTGTPSLYEKKFLWDRNMIAPFSLENVSGIVAGVFDITFKKDLDFRGAILKTYFLPGMKLFSATKGVHEVPRQKYGFLQQFMNETVAVKKGSTHELVMYSYYDASEENDSVKLQTIEGNYGDSYFLFIDPEE